MNEGNQDNLGAVFLSQRYSKLSGSQEVTEAAEQVEQKKENIIERLKEIGEITEQRRRLLSL